MDLKNILEYQKIDSELHALELRLARSENKKLCIVLSQSAKDAQLKSTQLETKAGDEMKRLEEAKKKFTQYLKLTDHLAKQDIEKMTKDEMEQNLTYKKNLSDNLGLLDKEISMIATNINAILGEYNKTRTSYQEAKEKYCASKAAYDKEVLEIEPKKKEIEKKLASFEKNVDPALMQKYKALRGDKIFPVFVPILNANSCGHCRMQLSASAISKLNREGVLVCENEHCRRIIYK